MLRLTPGDPAAILAGDAANTEQIAQIRTGLGLDRSIPEQFAHLVRPHAHAATSASRSTTRRRSPTLIGQRLEPTLSLAR